MTVKAVFFDIDGTLVSFDTHKVPESTKEALKALRQKGIRTFVCTGRPVSRVGFIKKAAEFDFDGIVAMNGQYCMVDGKLIYHLPIPKDNLERVIPYLDREAIACDFVESDYLYINRITDAVINFRKNLGGTIDPEPVDDVSRIQRRPTYQLCPFVTPEQEAEILRLMPDCRAVRWHPSFADIIPKKGGKAAGIREVIRHFEIEQKEVMAFGDGGNDIDMLEFAGVGVAMGNAHDRVKQAADYVTAAVDDHGVAKALEALDVL